MKNAGLLYYVGVYSSRGAALTKVAVDATHIFDGLNKFPTHITHMRNGSFVVGPVQWPLDGVRHLEMIKVAKNEGVPDDEADPVKAGSTLHSIAIMWLSEDRQIRLKEEQEGKRMKKRGARVQVGSAQDVYCPNN